MQFLKPVAAILTVLLTATVLARNVAEAQETPSRRQPQTAAELGVSFSNPQPAFARGVGPRVCMDGGHHNYQTTGRTVGGYDALSDLLTLDGYRVTDTDGAFSAELLSNCDVLITIDPREALGVPTFPHRSALTRGELETVYRWLQAGGGLFLITDHQPAITPFLDLGTMLGVVMIDGEAYLKWPYTNLSQFPEVFSRAAGNVREHAIFRGRNRNEIVDRVGTFQGSAFQASRDWSPLLVFGQDSAEIIDLGYNFRQMEMDQYPRFSINGWLLAATRRLDKGRVVLLGEAGTCSATVTGPNREPNGMNHPRADQNAQFCINSVRWLSGVLGD